MKLRIKIALCMLLILLAALSLTAVMGSLGVLPVSAAAEGYMLRDYDGYIAVWFPGGDAGPATVTDIRVRDLPLGDRAELAAGVTVSDYGAVLRLLEDYSS